MSVLTAGAWRGGLGVATLGHIRNVEKRRQGGFRALPPEAVMRELIDLLDGYDTLVSSLLLAEESSQASTKATPKPST